MSQLLRPETAVEFFMQEVETALAHQQLRAGILTSYYLVNLLADFVSIARGGGEAGGDQPLGMRYLRAFDAGGMRQREAFRQVADEALFLSGFFGEGLGPHTVPIDYYMSLGAASYSWLSQHERESVAPVFAELAERFVAFVDVLSEVSERSAVVTNCDLLRAYERWLRTGSARTEQLLVDHGIVVNPAGGQQVQ